MPWGLTCCRGVRRPEQRALHVRRLRACQPGPGLDVLATHAHVPWAQAALSELHLYASPSSASPNAKPFPCMAPAEARQRLLRALHYLLWLLDGARA